MRNLISLIKKFSMKVNWKLFVIIFSLIYIFVTLCGVYRLFDGSRLSADVNQPKEQRTTKLVHEKTSGLQQAVPTKCVIEIWGKAAIGLYLWKHILNGELEEMDAGLVQYGSLKRANINFTFRSGPGIIQTTVPNDVQYLVLVLNGRSEEKIESAKLWLDYLPLYSRLQKVGIVFLGNEQCDNDWLLPYMKSNGGKIDVVFLVYDSPLINNVDIYQWPLGVAVYRGFPNILPDQVDLMSTRTHLCNFMGTVYKNSSRELLMQVLARDNLQDQCIILGRKKWLPFETEDTLNTYIKSLLKSDLTLSPVGMNTECYRIYEAMSVGSVPVVEDVLTKGNCDKSTSPLRLLKMHGAPIIYLKDWLDLSHVLNEEAMLTLEEKVERRVNIVEWYTNFKKTLADTFVQIIEEKFFDNN